MTTGHGADMTTVTAPHPVGHGADMTTVTAPPPPARAPPWPYRPLLIMSGAAFNPNNKLGSWSEGRANRVKERKVGPVIARGRRAGKRSEGRGQRRGESRGEAHRGGAYRGRTGWGIVIGGGGGRGG